MVVFGFGLRVPSIQENDLYIMPKGLVGTLVRMWVSYYVPTLWFSWSISAYAKMLLRPTLKFSWFVSAYVSELLRPPVVI